MTFISEDQIEKSIYATPLHQLGGADSDNSEFDLFEAEQEARNELDRIGVKNSQLIEKLSGVSGIAWMLAQKMERHPEQIRKGLQLDFDKALDNIFQKIEDLEADYLDA